MTLVERMMAILNNDLPFKRILKRCKSMKDVRKRGREYRGFKVPYVRHRQASLQDAFEGRAVGRRPLQRVAHYRHAAAGDGQGCRYTLYKVHVGLMRAGAHEGHVTGLNKDIGLQGVKDLLNQGDGSVLGGTPMLKVGQRLQACPRLEASPSQQ